MRKLLPWIAAVVLFATAALAQPVTYGGGCVSNCTFTGNLSTTGEISSTLNTNNKVLAPSGGDYSTIVPANGTTCTLTVNDGTYTSSVPWQFNQTWCAGGFNITGQNAYSTNLTSVQSSSGSAGAWSIVLNVSTVANLVAGGGAVGVPVACDGMAWKSH